MAQLKVRNESGWSSFLAPISLAKAREIGYAMMVIGVLVQIKEI